MIIGYDFAKVILDIDQMLTLCLYFSGFKKFEYVHSKIFDLSKAVFIVLLIFDAEKTALLQSIGKNGKKYSYLFLSTKKYVSPKPINLVSGRILCLECISYVSSTT